MNGQIESYYALLEFGGLLLIFLAFRYLKKRPFVIADEKFIKMNVFKASLTKLWDTIKTVKQYPKSVSFLVAFLIYNDGIQGVITLAGTFATEDSKLQVSSVQLGIMIFVIQVIAIFGAIGFAKLADRISTKRAIIITLLIWCFIVIYPQFALNSVNELWFICILIGIVLGGSQSLSRSLFSRMIPVGLESAFFGFYEISERGTSWMAPLVYGAVNDAKNNDRLALLSLVVFFVVGVIVLPFVDTDKAIEEAKRGPLTKVIKTDEDKINLNNNEPTVLIPTNQDSTEIF